MYKSLFFLVCGIATNILCMEYEIKTCDNSKFTPLNQRTSKKKKLENLSEIPNLRITPKDSLRASILLGRIDLVVQLFDKEIISLEQIKKPEKLLIKALKSEKNAIAILNFLINKGINLNKKKPNPLAQACLLYCNQNQEQANRKNEIFEIIKCLLVKGADADLALNNASSTNGISLFYLIKNNSEKVLHLLLNYAKDKSIVNDFDNDMTPLMYSAEIGNLEIFELLKLNGADIEIYNKQQYSALDYALQNKNFGIAKRILDFKILNHKDISFREAVEIETTNLLQILSDLNITKETKNFGAAAFIVKYISDLCGLRFLKDQIDINELADTSNQFGKKPLEIFLAAVLKCDDIDKVLISHEQKWILDNFFSNKP